jgi:hypothetical protein
MADVRAQLSTNAVANKQTPKPFKKPVKKQTPKLSSKQPQGSDLNTQRKSAIDELDALDDSELSEIFKAYANEGQAPRQISLEHL